MPAPSDRDLGMGRAIPRRDFLNGVALAVGGALTAPAWARARTPAHYPPALTGLRGSEEGSYAVAHALKDGAFWESAGPPFDDGDEHDLVVVGAGLSGLAAAHYFRQAAGKRARILLLDNHDDFGGHARRNEFRVGGRLLIGYGGTYAIDSAAPYSAVARALVRELGVDVRRDARVYDRGLYPSLGLRPAVFFDRETFGRDALLPAPAAERGGEGGGAGAAGDWTAFLAAAPLSEAARRDLLRLVSEARDYLPGLSSAEKKGRLARLSYADYLTQIVGVDAGALPLLQARPHSLYGVGIDAVSAQDAWGLGYPGFDGLDLDPAPGPGMGRDAVPSDEAAEYFFHYPDGNASLARLLLRRLVPRAVPGDDADDVLLEGRTDYARLDEPRSPVRLRLRSTVVRVRHAGPEQVEVAYVHEGKLRLTRARRCLLACWHSVVPHLCPELPEAQKQALAYAVKVPIVYTNAVLRDFTSFHKLGVSAIHAPGGFHTTANLDLPVSLGGYRCPRDPREPVVVHMVRTPCHPGLPARDQHRLGRMELLNTTFEEFERRVRDQLARMLGPGGFDPARDLLALTVNRWPHGYAYQYNSLWDPFWLEGGETPCEVARRPFGRIALANADAAAYAYTDAAIDHAHRAVQELLRAAPVRA